MKVLREEFCITFWGRVYWAPNGDRYKGDDKSKSLCKMYLQAPEILRACAFGVMIFFLCSLICLKYWGKKLLVASREAALEPSNSLPPPSLCVSGWRRLTSFSVQTRMWKLWWHDQSLMTIKISKSDSSRFECNILHRSVDDSLKINA